jgi:hypothetical protein
MNAKILRRQSFLAIALLSMVAVTWTARPWRAQAADEPSFEQSVKPFLKRNCVSCHNEETSMSGVRVDHLDGSLEDAQIRLWEHIRKRVEDDSMPPKGLPRPSAADRQSAIAWMTRALDTARSRPSPKNGIARRLTIAQYRNTLRELLLLEDNLTEALPPDAVSVDGFVNNKDTLQSSPMLLEAYLEIASEALDRSIVDPDSKPAIQNFRVDLGASINSKPFPEQLILGANSTLLENRDFTVSEVMPVKPFAFVKQAMRTKYRFIEGYAGNDTVRGWRDYDSIYHSVFACMRGSGGYPKGKAYSTVAEGLLLRPAIPNEELFDTDGTYGPKANFKISLRELPDQGRFRVTVTAAKYNDGLLLDEGAKAGEGPGAIALAQPQQTRTVAIPKAGVYQVDVYAAPRVAYTVTPDNSRLSVSLGGSWPATGGAAKLEGAAKVVDSPFGKALSLEGPTDGLAAPQTDAIRVGEGDFTAAAWLQPLTLKRAGIVSVATNGARHGWRLYMTDERGSLRFDTAGSNNESNGSISSPPNVLRPESWQHVAVVVRRGKHESVLYVNGFAVAKSEIGAANLDHPDHILQIGRLVEGQQFKGDLADVRVWRRALDEAEIQALLEPGRKFVRPPPPEKPAALTLHLGGREFSGLLQQPAFLAVRLDAGPLAVDSKYAGMTTLDRIVLTPLAPASDVTKRFLTFEKRSPKVGVYVGLRRDCGSTLAPVGDPQAVVSTKLSRFVFEGAIENFPSPNVEKDNVNYLAGVREIGVRSEYTDGRDMPRLNIRTVEFEGPYYETWPPKTHRNIFVDFDRKSDRPAYARHVIRNFAARAYRRPVTAEEEASLLAVYSKSFAASSNFQSAVKDALQVALTSPQFLFLTETSSTPQPEPLDNYELASKLSYFLWNGPPDQITMQAAANGTLRARLDAEVTRMIAAPRFENFIREFVPQWLALDKFSVLEPDRKRFPKLTRDTRAQLRLEPMQFVQHLIRNNLPARNLIDSDFVIANEVVAAYYDMPEQTENGFRFAAIPRGKRDELGGLLTQPAILAGLSDGRESNPVKRGSWLARRIIAEPPDPPPPNVPALKEEEGPLTLRQRLEAHRNQPACAQCHAKIDPWGVALEEYDAGGRKKPFPVDARSTLPDKTDVAGIQDLKRYLAQDRIDQVAFSVLKHLATYANGRTLTYSELNALKQDTPKLRAGGYRMQDMIRFVASSKLFLEK